VFAHLVWPVMPKSAVAIHKTIQPVAGVDGLIPWPSAPMVKELDQLAAGQAITPADVLFAKITEEQIAEWKQRFGGGT
jgi:methionyl-tRNA synthetase